MTRIAIIAKCWGRPRLTRLFLAWHGRLRLRGVELVRVAAVSPEEDPHAPERCQGWHFFVGLCAEVLRLKAARKADFMLAYSAARSGKRSVWNAVLEQAGYGPAPGEAFKEPVWMDEAWEQRQLERIARMSKPGEA